MCYFVSRGTGTDTLSTTDRGRVLFCVWLMLDITPGFFFVLGYHCGPEYGHRGSIYLYTKQSLHFRLLWYIIYQVQGTRYLVWEYQVPGMGGAASRLLTLDCTSAVENAVMF